jgi:hypothetical protein
MEKESSDDRYMHLLHGQTYTMFFRRRSFLPPGYDLNDGGYGVYLQFCVTRMNHRNPKGTFTPIPSATKDPMLSNPVPE